ncbi:MAG: glycosyltransferase family 1 protein [Cyanobacteriota bacterium]|nr:glycosyltransferase family 1 protein [Cyanobacteriota bacterium]
MQLMHNGLKDFLLIGNYTPQQKIGFLSLETPLPEWVKKSTQSLPSYSAGLQLRREYRHIAMGLRALNFKEEDILFVFEIYNQHLSVVLPLLALMAARGKRVFIGLHGNQQFAMSSQIKYWGLLYLKAYLKLFKNLKVLTFEIDDRVIPEKYRLPPSSTIVIPHPILSDCHPKLAPGERLAEDVPIKIGVVGAIRADKPIGKIIEKIQEYIVSSPHSCEFVIGTPFGQKPNYLERLKVTLLDTTEEEDYLNALKEIDIIVIHYDKERYYYRTSGVISDAASCGCYIVASDYPVIQHQVTWPVTIGSTFSDFEEIGTAIDKGIDHLRENGQDKHWLWRKERTAEAIAKTLFSESARS